MHCTKFHPLKNVGRSRSFRKEFWFLNVLWLRWSRFVRRTEAHAWKEPRVSKFFVYPRVLLRFSCPISLKILRVDCSGAPIFSEYKCDGTPTTEVLYDTCSAVFSFRQPFFSFVPSNCAIDRF